MSEPEGGAFLRLLTSDTVAAATACFDASCEEISDVNRCIDAVFGFGDDA
ncbi:MAG: hypothetical protein GY811_06900 [Myxococcales bacterium]|nr:hypothetical protein [Myxococcales bacterium]